MAKKISKKTGGGVEIMGYWQNYVQKMAFTGKKHAEMPVTDIIFRTRHTRISLSVLDNETRDNYLIVRFHTTGTSRYMHIFCAYMSSCS